MDGRLYTLKQLLLDTTLKVRDASSDYTDVTASGLEFLLEQFQNLWTRKIEKPSQCKMNVNIIKSDLFTHKHTTPVQKYRSPALIQTRLLFYFG